MSTLIDPWNHIHTISMELQKNYAFLTARNLIYKNEKHGKQHKPLFFTDFKPHDCRTTSVSKTKVNQVPRAVVIKKECCKRESTFEKIYCKDIIG